MAKTYREVRRVLLRHGYWLDRTRGSHEFWRGPDGTKVTVAGGGRPGKNVPVGTLQSIRRTTGIEELR